MKPILDGLEDKIRQIITVNVCGKCPQCDDDHKPRCYNAYNEQAKAIYDEVFTRLMNVPRVAEPASRVDIPPQSTIVPEGWNAWVENCLYDFDEDVLIKVRFDQYGIESKWMTVDVLRLEVKRVGYAAIGCTSFKIKQPKWGPWIVNPNNGDTLEIVAHKLVEIERRDGRIHRGRGHTFVGWCCDRERPIFIHRYRVRNGS